METLVEQTDEARAPSRNWVKITAGLVAAGALAGGGVFAAFTDSDETSGRITIDDGVIDISDGGDAEDDAFGTDIAGLEPGDSTTQFISVENTGNQSWGTFTLTMSDALASGQGSPLLQSVALDTDGDGTGDGAVAPVLSLAIVPCGVAAAAPEPDDCTLPAVTVVDGGVVGVYDLSTLAPSPGETAYFLAEYEFSEQAPNELQNAAAQVDYLFEVAR